MSHLAVSSTSQFLPPPPSSPGRIPSAISCAMDKERRPASNRFQRRVILFTCLLFFHLLAFIFVFSSSLLRQLPPQPDVTLCWFGDDSVYDAGILPRSQERKSPASLVSELGHLTRPTGLQFDGEDALRRVGVLAVGGRHVIQSRFHDDSGTFSVGLEATQASLQYGGSFAAISASEPVWATPEGPQGTRLKHANLVELRGARMSKVWKDYDKGMRKTSAETPAAMCSTWNLVEMETETGTLLANHIGPFIRPLRTPILSLPQVLHPVTVFLYLLRSMLTHILALSRGLWSSAAHPWRLALHSQPRC